MTYKKSADVTGPHESLHQVQIIVSKKKKTSDRTNHCIGYKSSCPAQTDRQAKLTLRVYNEPENEILNIVDCTTKLRGHVGLLFQVLKDQLERERRGVSSALDPPCRSIILPGTNLI